MIALCLKRAKRVSKRRNHQVFEVIQRDGKGCGLRRANEWSYPLSPAGTFKRLLQSSREIGNEIARCCRVNEQ